jgi:hypothetical protein
MNTVSMRQFGQTLTDRADGKRAADMLVKDSLFPVALDFAGVMAMGSSFGDEVVLAIAARQNNEVEIRHANPIIRNCLMRVVENTPVKLKFTTP